MPIGHEPGEQAKPKEEGRDAELSLEGLAGALGGDCVLFERHAGLTKGLPKKCLLQIVLGHQFDTKQAPVSTISKNVMDIAMIAVFEFFG